MKTIKTYEDFSENLNDSDSVLATNIPPNRCIICNE